MRILFWTIGLSAIAVVFGFIIIALLKFLNKEWWKINLVRKASRWLIYWGILSITIWVGGLLLDFKILAIIGSTSAVIMLTISLGLIISLPFSGILNIFAGRQKKTAKEVNDSRRKFLRRTAVAFPAIAIGFAGNGLASAHSETKMDRLKFEFADLPDDLDGLKILHLSDTHLGIYKQLYDLEKLAEQATEKNPDIVLYTGDLADELTLLPDALKIIESIGARYGTYASLGNHEYYRGIKAVLSAFESSPIPLLVDSGINIPIKNSNLYLSGIDDPRMMNQDNSKFLHQSLEKSLDGAPSNSFKIAMSHRPEALEPASKLGIDLVLAGHTHGGQIGWGSRSFFSLFSPDSYLRGHYSNNGTQMYVSSGFGHWFPFRLGCPTEAPIIELVKKSQALI